eukprot:scaffold64865_cov33-Tisochrysis_lutea.AAC.3
MERAGAAPLSGPPAEGAPVSHHTPSEGSQIPPSLPPLSPIALPVLCRYWVTLRCSLWGLPGEVWGPKGTGYVLDRCFPGFLSTALLWCIPQS